MLVGKFCLSFSSSAPELVGKFCLSFSSSELTPSYSQSNVEKTKTGNTSSLSSLLHTSVFRYRQYREFTLPGPLWSLSLR